MGAIAEWGLTVMECGMGTDGDKLLQLFVILHYFGANQAFDAVFGLKNCV
jgi:hypothetical protein